MFYDPMIAKLVTWAPTREAAIDAQVAALDAFEIDGIGHNVDFLSALMQHPRFRDGHITTDFIAEEYPEGFEGAPADAQLIADLAAIAAMIETTRRGARGQITTSSHRHRAAARPWREDRRRDFTASHRARSKAARWPASTAAIRSRCSEAGCRASGCSASHRRAAAHRSGEARRPEVALTTRGASHKVQVLDPHVAELSVHMIEKVPPDLSRLLLAPMPGLVTRLEVKTGDKVEPGQTVAIMEAMKMENILRAQGGDGQGDAGEGGRKCGGRSGHRGV